MRRILTYLALAVVSSSCTFWEEATTTELLRPGAAVRIDSINAINVFIFDSRDTLVQYQEYQVKGAIDSLPIVDGVPEGDYRVVSFVNFDRYKFEPMTAGLSSYQDLECEFVRFIDPDTGDPISSSDSILYGNQFVTARWGWGSRAPVPIVTRQLYYNTSLRIVTTDGYDFWKEVTGFSLELRRLPRRFDNTGTSNDPSVKFLINNFLVDDPQGVAARMRLPRFTDNDRVELHAVSNGYSLGSVVLKPSAFGVDPASSDPVSFTIELRIQPRVISIVVEGWKVGEIQITQIG